jgi:hypothetical protein
VDIPHGAVITAASVLFTVDEVHAGQSDQPVEVTIYGVRGPSKAPTAKAFDIGHRSLTHTSASWRPASSSAVGEQLVTGDIAHVVQEVVGGASWKPGSSLGLQFSHASGNGIRWVESLQRLVAGSYAGTMTPALMVTYDY